MSAYAIVEVDVHNPALFDEYRKLAPATIAQYGGKYLVRGGASETKEGSWAPKRMVVLEFPSMDQARKWYHSPEYALALATRLKAANSKMILVEGI